jgi:alkylhydroperoxidase family enzyme
MSRIPYPDAGTLSAEKRAVLADKRVLNVSRMIMHAPDELWTAWRGFARTAAYKPSIDPALRELCILRVAYISKSDYEVLHHFQTALDAGAPREKCLAMQSGSFGVLDPQERAMIAFVSEIVENVSPGDATLHEVRAHFSDEKILEVIMLVGAYMIMARVIATGGVGPEEAAVTGHAP